VFVEHGNIPSRDEEISAPEAGYDADHGRVIVLAVSDQNVADRSDLIVSGVENGLPDHLGYVQHYALR
jgi:hypothetical protein